MKLWKRVALTLAVGTVQALYFPINRGMTGGVMLKTPLDEYIPLWPIWVVPYMLTWFIWGISAVWAVLKMEEQMFKAALVGLFTVVVIGLAWFALYPTYILRPTLEGDSWAIQILRFVYHNDHVYNAFPSGHVYITTIIALFWSRWYPRYRWLWLGVLAVIALSTLFTHQHYLPDPVAGLALGLGGYHFGQRVVKEWSPGPYGSALKEMPR